MDFWVEGSVLSGGAGVQKKMHAWKSFLEKHPKCSLSYSNCRLSTKRLFRDRTSSHHLPSKLFSGTYKHCQISWFFPLLSVSFSPLFSIKLKSDYNYCHSSFTYSLTPTHLILCFVCQTSGFLSFICSLGCS